MDFVACLVAVFAPTDYAFQALPNGTLDYLLANKDILQSILSYHVLAGRNYSTQLNHLSMTLQGSNVVVRRTYSSFFPFPFIWYPWGTPSTLTVNQARIVQPDAVIASNGVIHAIDQVLLPPGVATTLPGLEAWIPNVIQAAQALPVLSKFERAIAISGLAAVLQSKGPYTVFAPSNEAFEQLPENVVNYLMHRPLELRKVLLYHVVNGASVEASSILDGSVKEAQTFGGDNITFSVGSGSAVSINDGAAKVEQADVKVSNGIIHVIGSVLIPPGLSLPSDKNLVFQAAQVAGSFFASLQAANMTALLETGGPFTVFAPTDDAFEAIQDTVDELLANNTPRLVEILKYHVLPHQHLTSSFLERFYWYFMAPTLLGRPLSIQASRDTATVGSKKTVLKVDGDATILQADVMASNGVIHVIDQVLIPPTCPFPQHICKLFPGIPNFTPFGFPRFLGFP